MKTQKLKSLHYVHSSINKYSTGSSVMIPLIYSLARFFLCYNSRVFFLTLLPQSVLLWQVCSNNWRHTWKILPGFFPPFFCDINLAEIAASFLILMWEHISHCAFLRWKMILMLWIPSPGLIYFTLMYSKHTFDSINLEWHIRLPHFLPTEVVELLCII